MKVTILNFGERVHLAGCRDIKRDVLSLGEEDPWTLEVTSRADLTKQVYGDHMKEAEGEPAAILSRYMAEFHYLNCCASLPEHDPTPDIS